METQHENGWRGISVVLKPGKMIWASSHIGGRFSVTLALIILSTMLDMWWSAGVLVIVLPLLTKFKFNCDAIHGYFSRGTWFFFRVGRF